MLFSAKCHIESVLGALKILCVILQLQVVIASFSEVFI